MGLLDKLLGKAGDVAEQHSDKVKEGIDKVADIADDKYSDQIDSGAEKAKDVVDDLGDEKS